MCSSKIKLPSAIGFIWLLVVGKLNCICMLQTINLFGHSFLALLEQQLCKFSMRCQNKSYECLVKETFIQEELGKKSTALPPLLRRAGKLCKFLL